MHDPLHHLLQQTDRTLAERPRVIPAETLLSAAHRRRGQSQRRRVAVAGVTAVLAGVTGALMAPWRQLEAPRQTRSVVQNGGHDAFDIPAPRTPEELRQEIAALEREAVWRTKMTKGLIANDMSPLRLLSPFGETQDAESANSQTLADMADLQYREDFESLPVPSLNAPSLNNADWLRVESARSAALSWHYAHMAEHEFHDTETARREYERLIERFPGTAWAQRSQVSLDRILTSHKTPL